MLFYHFELNWENFAYDKGATAYKLQAISFIIS